MNKLISAPFCIATIFVCGCLDVPEPPPPVVIAPNSAPMPVASNASPASTPAAGKDFALLQGTWTGHDVTPGHESPASITFTGHNLEFHGANGDDWCTAAFTLNEETNPKQIIGTINNAPSQDAIGKKATAIYKIENGALMLSGFAPGSEALPSSFDASGARQLVLKRQE